MKQFFRDWNENFKRAIPIAFLMMIVINWASLLFEGGVSEFEQATQQYGLTLALILLAFSVALNTVLIALVVSLIHTLIELLGKK